MILGTQSMNGTMYRSDGYTVEPAGRDLGEAIREALCAALPVRTWHQPVALTEQPRPAEITFSVAMTNPAEAKRVDGLKEIYLAAKHLLGAETEGANGADLRQTLNQVYDRFVTKFGPIVRSAIMPEVLSVDDAL